MDLNITGGLAFFTKCFLVSLVILFPVPVLNAFVIAGQDSNSKLSRGSCNKFSPQLFGRGSQYRKKQVEFSNKRHLLAMASSNDKTFYASKNIDSKVTTISTQPFDDMKPGTSGLRKRVSVFMNDNYLNNFVQAYLNTLEPSRLSNCTLVIGGDGRYYNKEAIQKIIPLLAANGVKRCWVGKGGLLSTPAISAIIRERENGIATGGIVLTASHNPGGPNGDFGIKFNMAEGEPAPEAFTDKLYQNTLNIKDIRTLESNGLPEKLSNLEKCKVGESFQVGDMEVEIIDPVEDYIKLLRKVFDFQALKRLIARKDFSCAFDGMHGASGPYAKAILVNELGMEETNLLRCNTLEDFGGLHPDPNLVYAKELVMKMGLTSGGEKSNDASLLNLAPDFGAAADGDGDRNMILGRGFFVTPSDSLALIAANAKVIPWFKSHGGLKTVARSMPSSKAVDLVANNLKYNSFVTPTGWKFFGNLMDSIPLRPVLCGEESFGTGSDHIREKDGLWAVLAWLSILADRNSDESKPFFGVEEIVKEHWTKFGRTFYCRYDYEEVEASGATKMMEYLSTFVDESKLQEVKESRPIFNLVESIEEFTYKDPIDGSVSVNQGTIINFKDTARAVFRLSGTGSQGATVRMYLEKHENVPDYHTENSVKYLEAIANLAIQISNLKEFTNRESPTVIT